MNQTGKVVAALVVVLLVVFEGCGPGAGTEGGTRVEKVYWPGGKLRREVTLRDSVRHGPSRNYYRNGAVRLAMEYEDGIRVGEAVIYYEDGTVYQVTPFVGGTRHGIQRRYYPGGGLMAEMPYSNNELVEGLKEYSKEGRLLTPQAHIVFELRDRLQQRGHAELLMRLSDGCTRVQFGRYLHDTLQGRGGHYPLISEKGRASLRFPLAPGASLHQTVYVRGERPSPLGNTEIFQGQYVLRISRLAD